jgi:NTP pyrophosphatase (non-canonical NTP hydrolase)
MEDTLKQRIAKFVVNAWGADCLYDRKERAVRVLEEAAELAQAEHVAQETAHRIVGRVYFRPCGNVFEEAGDVFFTLLAWAWAADSDLEFLTEKRMERAEGLSLDYLRKKHEEKRAAGTSMTGAVEVPEPNAKWRTQHVLVEPEGQEGVAGCTVCGGFEGSLPLHCPGTAMTVEDEQQVYARALDFARGIWWRPRV